MKTTTLSGKDGAEMNKVFLGGTCNDSIWRAILKPNLEIDFFDPVVDDWTLECQEIEIREKQDKCNIHLYVITKEMTGVFSIAEVIESAMTSGKETIFHVMPIGFDERQLKSLAAVIDMVIRHGGVAYMDIEIDRTIEVLNSMNPPPIQKPKGG